jgi:hypothetical protein
MTGTNYSNSKVNGVAISRPRLSQLLHIMQNASRQGMSSDAKIDYENLIVKLKRRHNELEFDSVEEMDATLKDFPEWHRPDSMEISLTAVNHSYSTRPYKSFARSTRLVIKPDDACSVYAGGEASRWGLTTGSLLESQLRTFRGWHRWNRLYALLAVVLISTVWAAFALGTIWFLVPSLFGAILVCLILAGMPLGRWFRVNRISLGS